MLEESFERLSREQCRKYLKRLGLKEPEECSREFLNLLIERHLCTVAFENVDLARTHMLVNTELETLYHKVVENGRGGYCFELNALFLGLLRGLGYDAYPVACRVMKVCAGGIKAPTHRASVVRLEGKKYFCDVGFGGIACTRAACMEPGIMTETAFGSFCFEREYEGWLLQRYMAKEKAGQKPEDVLMVAESSCAPVDFLYANRAMCEPGSHFYEGLVVQRITEYGPCSIDGNHVKIRDENGKREFDVTDPEEMDKILRDKFLLKI